MSNSYLFNGWVYIDDNYDNCSSSQDTGLIIGGDTIRISTQRTPASNGLGNAGEFSFGVSGGTCYLYYCVSDNNWQRMPFSTY